MAEAFQAIEETSLKATLDQTLVDIRMLSGEISDIMTEIDKSDGLRKTFTELFGHLWSGCAYALEHNNFDALVEHLKDASNLRRAIYLQLQEYQLDL